jgi:aryl-alcohol dehydrogenase-like predicted oxidoreductase
MTSIIIENTDVRVSRLSFGTAALHHLLRTTQRQRLLALAADAGITHFDTSPYYGYGLAESDLGTFVRGRRAMFTLTTKVGLYPPGKAPRSGWQVWLRKAKGKLHGPPALPVVNWSLGRARESFQSSLNRLSTDYVDFLFLHEPELALVPTDEFLPWLESERNKGSIRHWGLAGTRSFVEPWLQANSPLAAVIQTRDDVTERPADFVLQHNRNLQFTYGYLSAHAHRRDNRDAHDVVKSALARNARGAVLFSTRRAEHLSSIAALAQ